MIYKWRAEKKADEDIEHVFQAGQRGGDDDDDDDDDDDVAGIIFKIWERTQSLLCSVFK